MARTTSNRGPGRPADPSKAVIWSRIDKEAIKGLDKIRKDMRPRPSRAQLIDLAVQEFVERRQGDGRDVVNREAGINKARRLA